MLEQPLTAAPTAMIAAQVLVLADDILDSLRKIEHMSGIRQLSTHRGTQLLARNLGLAGQEEIGIVPWHRIVERRLDRITGPRRVHKAGRDDDGEVGFVPLIGAARKQRAEYRHVAEPGHLLLIALVGALQQPADDEALAVAQLDRG